MNRLPILEKFILTVFAPQINIYNSVIMICETEYDEDGKEIFKSEDYPNFDTYITINNSNSIKEHENQLYKLKEQVIEEIVRYCKDKSKPEIKDYLATIFFNLPKIENYYSQIKHNYKLSSVTEEMIPVVEENGITILLEGKHDKQIRSFDETGLKFYIEIFNTYKKFYRLYHNRFNIENVQPPVITLPDGINTFRFADNIAAKDYSRIYLLLNGNIIRSDPDTFHKAFSGEMIHNPLKIKWLIEYRQHINVRALFYFLESVLFIPVDDDNLFLSKIKYVFTDKNGESLSSRLSENLRQFNLFRDKIEHGNQIWKKRIDNLVQTILS
jgi:hypothetical protein